MSRCALFVDAGYALADGAMAVHGTRRQDSVSWDHAGLIKLLSGIAKDRSGLAVLRCYWYEAALDGHRTPVQEALAEMPGVKLRLASTRPGRREGVEALLRRDLVALAKNKAIAEAVVASADEGLAEVVAEVQELGLRVTVLHVSSDSGWTVPQSLRQESDDLIEISGTHLRPFVDLVRGAEPAGSSDHFGTRGTGTQQAQQLALPAPGGPYAVQGGEYPQPFAGGRPQHAIAGPEISLRPGAPGGLNGAGYGTGPLNGAGPDGYRNDAYLAAANGNGGANGASRDGGYQNGAQPNGAQPNGAQPNGAYQNGAGQNGAYQNGNGNARQGAWQIGQSTAGDSPYGQFGNAGAGGASQNGAGGASQNGAAQNGAGQNGAGYEAAPITPQAPAPADPSAAYLAGRAGPAAGGPEQSVPPAPSYQPGSYLGSGQQPAAGQFQSGNQFQQGELSQQIPQPSQYQSGPSQYQPAQFQQPAQYQPAQYQPAQYQPAQFQQPAQYQPGQFQQPAQLPAGGQVQAGGQLERVASAQAARPQQLAAMPLTEAVKAAHAEGFGFGESVGRDAPTLWLDAVLARKPRMPSDLEARLLQGSALPIDSLLHDEVRHSLRRGFWDALETARR